MIGYKNSSQGFLGCVMPIVCKSSEKIDLANSNY